MSAKDERQFFAKIYILIILTMSVIAGLLFFILSGSADTLKDAVNHANDEPPACEPCPAVDPPSPADEPKDNEKDDPPDEPQPVDEPDDQNENEDPKISVPDITGNDSLLKIVNPFSLIDPSFVPADLRTVHVPSNGEQQLRDEAAGAMEEMFAAAEQDGISLYLVSGYRSYEYQSELWNWWVEHYGEEHARRIDDYPGGSEHQIGLSADLGSADHNCELNTCFAENPASSWLLEHAWEYGYIERYPAGKESVTGIMFSPWNYRYVGREEAEAIRSSGLSMEEYYDFTG